MILLVSIAIAGTLQVAPDRLHFRGEEASSGIVQVTNTGAGRISGSVRLTEFGSGRACADSTFRVTPSTLRLLPGHTEQVRVDYAGGDGCLSAVGLQVGPTEILIPVLVSDNVSVPVVVGVRSNGAIGATLDLTVMGEAPVQTQLSIVQQDADVVARLQTVSLVLLPHEHTLIELPLASPATPTTRLHGVMTTRGTVHTFERSISMYTAAQTTTN